MHKEIVSRNKLFAIFICFFMLVIAICASEVVQTLQFRGLKLDGASTITFAILLAGMIYIELLKCNKKYKYSIIADQFIIHKLKGSDQVVVENIKLRNIVQVEKSKYINKEEKYFSTRKYTCSLFNKNVYCCVYKDGDKLKKFYFQPSEGLLKKLIINKTV